MLQTSGMKCGAGEGWDTSPSPSFGWDPVVKIVQFCQWTESGTWKLSGFSAAFTSCRPRSGWWWWWSLELVVKLYYLEME